MNRQHTVRLPRYPPLRCLCRYMMDEQMFANVPEEECERILGMMETVQENLEKAIQGGTHEKTV